MSGGRWKERMVSKITLHSSSKKCRKVILCDVEIHEMWKAKKKKNVDFSCRSSQVPRELMGGG